ncbi:MAG: hypothetical protein J5959_07420, partial [Butyrivibrio sp.]|nr:hypothetical protein [Butyrivibrio sp.]
MKHLKRSMSFILALFLLNMFTTITVEASDNITLSNFDYVHYADNYPDLKAAYGYDAKALYSHYKNLGRAEGRLGIRTRASYLPMASFDDDLYASENPDVVSAVGISKKNLYNHYQNFGQYEGRSAWSTNSSINAQLKAYDIVVTTTNGSMPEYERIRAVHDWIVKNVHYNVPAYTSGNFSDSDYTAVGPLLMGTGV